MVGTKTAPLPKGTSVGSRSSCCCSEPASQSGCSVRRSFSASTSSRPGTSALGARLPAARAPRPRSGGALGSAALGAPSVAEPSPVAMAADAPWAASVLVVVARAGAPAARQAAVVTSTTVR